MILRSKAGARIHAETAQMNADEDFDALPPSSTSLASIDDQCAIGISLGLRISNSLGWAGPRVLLYQRESASLSALICAPAFDLPLCFLPPTYDDKT